MIDWYSVKFLYPLSFQRFVQTMYPNTGLVSLNMLKYFDNKKLYSFFDKEGIFLTIERYPTSQWVYNITLMNGTVSSPTTETLFSRDDAEYVGFYECFQLLNDSLSKK